MSIISEVKCARCDRVYSGVRSRCPYCGARRIGSGKYSEENDNSKGKMIVGVLIMTVLVVAAGVLLFTAPTPEEAAAPPPTNNVSTPPTTPVMPNEADNTGVPGRTSITPPTETQEEREKETPTPTPTPRIQSVVITYAGVIKDDFTEKVGGKVPLRARIEPPGIEFTEEIVWLSSNPNVFAVVKDSPDGSSATVTGIGVGTATLTVIAGDVKAECIVRIIAG